jgi:16S rRNA (guanine966-N2)-methyltransferase
MRIIAGSKRGMKLLPPKTHDTRPITDRVKESLFSVLYKYDVIEDGVIGDLFCGTGSMGLEALSRGAKWVTFAEKDLKVAAILDKNIERGGFGVASKIIKANAFKVGAPVEVGGAAEEKYNLVFVDPPYKMSMHADTHSQLGRLLLLLCEQLADEGIVSVRTHKGTELLDEYDRLKVIDRRQWGSMAVTLLQLGDR